MFLDFCLVGSSKNKHTHPLCENEFLAVRKSAFYKATDVNCSNCGNGTNKNNQFSQKKSPGQSDE